MLLAEIWMLTGETRLRNCCVLLHVLVMVIQVHHRKSEQFHRVTLSAAKCAGFMTHCGLRSGLNKTELTPGLSGWSYSGSKILLKGLFKKSVGQAGNKEADIYCSFVFLVL